MWNLNRAIFGRRVPLLAFALLSAAVVVEGQDKADVHNKKRATRRSIFETEHSCKSTHGNLRTPDLIVLDLRVGASTIRDVQKRFPGTSPVKLTHGEESEEGICVKNREGIAAVFASGIMGSPDTLTGIYLAPSRLVEDAGVRCTGVDLPSKNFASQSAIKVGASATDVSRTLRAKFPAEGPFCASYLIASNLGPLQLSKGIKDEAQFTDFTGAEGYMTRGKVKWVVLFGVASD